MHDDAKTFQTACRNSKALARKNILRPILSSATTVSSAIVGVRHTCQRPLLAAQKNNTTTAAAAAALRCHRLSTPPTTSNLAARHRRRQHRSQLQYRRQGNRQHPLDVFCSSRLCRGQGQRQATIGWRRRGHQQKKTVSIINAMPYGHIIHIINHHAARGRRRQAVHAGSFPQNRNIHFAPAM